MRRALDPPLRHGRKQIPELLVLHRRKADEFWTAQACTVEDTLELPEVGLALPVAELYEDVVFVE